MRGERMTGDTEMPVVFDASLALEQAGGNQELAKELMGMLLKDLPLQQASLDAAIKTGNTAAMWEHAHKLYGSTAYCGVPALRAASRALEAAIKAVDHELIDSSYASVATAIADLLSHGDMWLERDWQ
jgi:two-component system, NarL family, sensor histidine kinase BarA